MAPLWHFGYEQPYSMCDVNDVILAARITCGHRVSQSGNAQRAADPNCAPRPLVGAEAYPLVDAQLFDEMSWRSPMMGELVRSSVI